MRISFHGLTLDLPAGWVDIGEEGSVPTLAHPDGAGAIQFSVSRYRSGAEPAFDVEKLRHLLVDFCAQRSPRCGEIVEGGSDQAYVETLCESGDELLGLWYVTNGRDVAFLTYTSLASDDPKTAAELDQARGIVRSVAF